MATNGGVNLISYRKVLHREQCSMKGLVILHPTLYMYNLMDIPCNIRCTNIKVVTNNSSVNTIRVNVYDCVPSPYILSDYYNRAILIFS